MTVHHHTAFNGVARRLVPPFIALTAIGWLLVVIGFGIGSTGDNDQSRNTSAAYLYWVVCLTGPFIFAAAIIHAANWEPLGLNPFIKPIIAFLNIVWITGLGMILYVNGAIIENTIDPTSSFSRDNTTNSSGTSTDLNRSFLASISEDVPDYINLEFAGAFLALLFWTPVVVLWQFYDGFWPKDDEQN